MLLNLVDNKVASVKSAVVATAPPANVVSEIGPTMPGMKNPITAEPNTIFAESVRKSVMTSIS
ncbi:MAG: hypothetical protein UX43_C0003G0098 [Candidatus Giovannonibacteria bacterium GW2011_GWB1_46_20]|uniref:Uncharacterized protein n=1 Tax=Candidatus Giovannonibacteria bacterium GW2011_GWA1_44_25 TaxID=1618645 RepID=A0A0G1IMM0_9BACT|nr:MAG: hypothetical protein UW15_C0004G0023 [Parcubacteria group bacterium GW2011_GWC1_44_10]KKT60158.1 MAG: hypothetical protein UW53_C0003G0069 [Candidatus Giovannonibacteria bacterium GW2011_GWA1_44_25]KKU30005.1 MAG: hypothetical protein UX43_C0003G0098 [Candidatus Giovannonibacteria bacterium GW2011_GWB1_46_20]